MEDLYSIHPGISRGWEASAEISGGEHRSDLTDLMKSQIASHPRYPSLVSAYIECRKVGAPPEMATLLEETGREYCADSRRRGQIGVDPELDEFMDSYCAVLEKYKEELSRPFDEAATFLCSIETQLRNLCSNTGRSTAATNTSGHLDENAKR